MMKAWICTAMFLTSFALFAFALSVQNDRFTWTRYREPLVWDATPLVTWMPTIEALQPDPAELSDVKGADNEGSNQPTLESIIYLPEVLISGRPTLSPAARARAPRPASYQAPTTQACPSGADKKPGSGLATICG